LTYRPDKQIESPHTPLMLAGLAFILSLILRHLPVLKWLVYPFQLFVTLIHELSHGLAALLTGGRFLEFTIAPNTTGVATTSGGWRWLIIPAGYVGAALFGGLLLVLINRKSGARGRRWLTVGLGVFFALTTALFARNLTAIIIGSATALTLLGLGWHGPPLLLLFGLNLLAIQSALNAFDSLLGLTRLSAGPLKLANDAQSMAELTQIPALVWAILWTLVALAILGGSIYVSLRHRSAAR
jgi:hypothetical protein